MKNELISDLIKIFQSTTEPLDDPKTHQAPPSPEEEFEPELEWVRR